ncbi:molybdenum cofactor guanylyltransferase [Stieleria sp. JC731]|uniref:molybdenum cofactor guanylyltransferase n=1 Tax=Pirellulaceae TaxID=2691357 RepID=UPI001E56AE0F|nr:molybdenum cofactor guanylyltransferase [Stieleria sp. JC731]MCC9600864.1 molybdenum cofactor guanylyltransferase [Stieleria sp. JC731]
MSRPTELRLLGIVLCGGLSKRMGRDKAGIRLPVPMPKDPNFLGENFLEHAVARLLKVTDTVRISVANLDVELPSRFNLIADAPPSCGPISGIQSSLTYARDHQFSGCIFTAVDTPLLTDKDIHCLIRAYSDDPTKVVCADGGAQSKYEPLIGIYPTAVIPVIDQSILQGEYGLQRLLDKIPTRRIELPTASIRNFNTPSDLQHLPTDS